LPPYAIDAQREIEVQHEFTDTIIDIKMKQLPNSGSNAYMAVAGWDGKILIYTVSADGQQTTPMVNPFNKVQCNGPILGICWEELGQ